MRTEIEERKGYEEGDRGKVLLNWRYLSLVPSA